MRYFEFLKSYIANNDMDILVLQERYEDIHYELIADHVRGYDIDDIREAVTELKQEPYYKRLAARQSGPAGTLKEI